MLHFLEPVKSKPTNILFLVQFFTITITFTFVFFGEFNQQLNCSYRHLLDWSVESVQYIQYNLNGTVPVSR